MLLRQQVMQGHEIGATLLATFVSELKKSYTLCHFITKYFLLQTTLNSISESFSTKYHKIGYICFESDFGALGQTSFQKALYYVN